MLKIAGAKTTTAPDSLSFLPVSRLAIIPWALALLGLASLLITFPRSPLPWFDEILMESTAVSIVHGTGAMPAVLDAFHGIRPLSLFFGPTALALGAADVRLFGVSLVAWRALGWLGVVTLTLLAFWSTKRLAGGNAAAATAALVAFSQGTGRAVSGRLDSLAVALELASLGCAIASIQTSRPAALRLAALSGIFCTLAILSTPRAFPFGVSLFLAFGVEFLYDSPRRRELSSRTAIAAGVVALLIVAWTLFEGTNPIGWARFILSVSHSDSGNVSPLLGGNWHLFDGPVLEIANGFGFLLVLFVLAISAGAFLSRARRSREPFDSGLRFALVAAIANYALTFLLISRFWDYDIFVVPLLLPAAVALTGKLVGGAMPSYRRVILISAWILWASICVGIRAGKMLVWANSYRRSDAATITRFVAQNVPQGSIVFGPMDDYYYAVENAGSRYLYPKPWIAEGFNRDISDKRPAWDGMLRSQSVYVIWPSESKLPEGLTPDCLQPLATYRPQAGHVRAIASIADGGYPTTVIYRVVRDPQ